MDDVGEIVCWGRGQSDGFRRHVGGLDEQKRRVAGKVLRRAGIRDDYRRPRIRDDGGEDVFVHISAVERAGMDDLREGQKLEFELEMDRKSGKQAATNLKDLS